LEKASVPFRYTHPAVLKAAATLAIILQRRLLDIASSIYARAKLLIRKFLHFLMGLQNGRVFGPIPRQLVVQHHVQ